MNDNILCIYYSRTGHTERVMREIAAALDCEVLRVRDRVDRAGVAGWLRCGLDAMRKRTHPVNRLHMEHRLSEYDLVILGTPVWAGRCSAVMRGFLKRRGLELQDVALVLTHASEEPYRAVFDQIDGYLMRPHIEDVSLQPGSAGYFFWRDQFIKTIADRMGIEPKPVPENEAEEAAAEAKAEPPAEAGAPETEQ